MDEQQAGEPVNEQPVIKSRRWRDYLVIAGIVLAVGSILLNFALLFLVNNITRSVKTQLLNQVGQLEEGEFTYNFPLSQTLPLRVAVPISESLDIPVKLNLRIKTTFNIPIDIPIPDLLGGGNQNFTIPVPVDTTIPIDETFPFSLNRTFNLSTTVPISLTIPITVRGSEFKEVLDRFKQVLRLAAKPGWQATRILYNNYVVPSPCQNNIEVERKCSL